MKKRKAKTANAEAEKELGELLRRDALRSDYIVLPLAAGVLARLVLLMSAVEDSSETELEPAAEAARGILRSVAPEHDAAWRTDTRPFMDVEGFVLDNWFLFREWLPFTYRFADFEDEPAVAGPTHFARAQRWLKRNSSAPLVDSMLVAALALDDTEHKDDECPLIARSARPVRVILADRVRKLADPTWPGILRAVEAEWTPDTVGRHAFLLAEAAHDAIDRLLVLAGQFDEMESALATRAAPESRPSPKVETTQRSMQMELQSQRERTRILEGQLAAARQQSALHSERAGRRTSHVAAVEGRLRQAEKRVGELEAELAVAERERREFKAMFREEERSTPISELPADALAGKRVLVFTGATAEAQAEMEQAFYAFGATGVTCYSADRRLSASVPGDAIVVLDVRFMSHSLYETVTAAARRSGASWYASTRGAALIARDVVSRLTRDRQRSPG